ncbi:MAG: hypothetical protein KC800_29415 [Candidatus Eremiobacteraeota bacterium]|nr:hypothetical protein [Candidatus Eremiobacteraeota bacterium]
MLLLIGPALAERWPEALEAKLTQGRITSIRSLSSEVEDWDGSNDYHVLTLANGLKGVFRSEDEPWGSVAEAVAYLFDRRLGTELVPPTVLRTLTREELGEAWPWETDTRPGSLQLFVEGARPSEESDLVQPDRANSEILCFLLGRYDNHAANLLVAPDGHLLLVDFEGMLDIQQVRYGEFPFLRRGGWHEGGLSGEEPFPFDNPSKLVDPTLEEIRSTFGPWWGQFWPQGMNLLYKLLNGIPERTIPYVIWDGRLWVQVKVRSRHPAFTDFYPDITMRNLERLEDAEIRTFLREPLGEAHLQGIWERRRQLLEAWKKD